MFHLFIPVGGIAIAVGLFFLYVQPTFTEAQLIKEEASQYTEAIDRAAELETRVRSLKERQSAIPLADLERLEAFLPDSVDEVAVLVDLSGLAEEHNLVFTDVNNDENAENAPVEDPEDFIADSDSAGSGLIALRSQYETHDVTFSVEGTYNDFKEFLTDAERSLMFMEIMGITFSESEGDLISFSVRTRFYSLNRPGS